MQVNEGCGYKFDTPIFHLITLDIYDKMALINYTKYNKKRTETSINTIE